MVDLVLTGMEVRASCTDHVSDQTQQLTSPSDLRKAVYGDDLGGTGSNGTFKDVCLITSLRSLGLDVPYKQSGPFRALLHGNPMIQPLGYTLCATKYTDISPGNFVTWKGGHFTAVIVSSTSRVIEMDGSMHTEHSCLHALGLPDERTWFRLQKTLGSDSLPASPAVPASLPLDMLRKIGQRRLRAQLLRDMNTSRKRKGTGDPDSGIELLTAAMKQRREDALLRQRSRLVRPLPPLGWQHPREPAPPSSFHMRPVLPAVTFLSLLNAHERDLDLLFFEEEHKYFFKGARTCGSVTGLIHQYACEFDAGKIIERMRNGCNWPRAEYLAQTVSSEVLREIACCDGGIELAVALEATMRDDDEVVSIIRRLRQQGCLPTLLLSALCMTPNQIVEKWDRNKTIAANAGTYMHWRFEAWLNRVPVMESGPEFAMLRKYTSTLTGLTCYRTEWTIFASEENIAGSIDFVAINENGELVLFDWKRSKADMRRDSGLHV